MKALKTLFALSLVTIFLSSYMVPQKNAELVPYITFVNEAGEERTKSLTTTINADWKDDVKSAEFRKGDIAIEVEGLVVYLPKNGVATVVFFKEKTAFTSSMQKIVTDHSLNPGDRIIIDNLKIVGETKSYYPVVHTVK